MITHDIQYTYKHRHRYKTDRDIITTIQQYTSTQGLPTGYPGKPTNPENPGMAG